MTTTWSEASNSVLTTAQELIDQFHKQIKELRIGFIFRSEAAVSQGIMVNAGVSKVPDKFKVLLELDLIIWIAEDEWIKLSQDQRKALVDHQLCHIRYDGTIVGHDFEDFQEIVERYGFWNYSLLKSADTFKEALQLDLGLKVETKGKVVAVQPEIMQQLPTVQDTPMPNF